MVMLLSVLTAMPLTAFASGNPNACGDGGIIATPINQGLTGAYVINGNALCNGTNVALDIEANDIKGINTPIWSLDGAGSGNTRQLYFEVNGIASPMFNTDAASKFSVTTINRASINLGNVGFSDSMENRWTGPGPFGGTTTYYLSRNTSLSTVWVENNGIALNWYENHRGTYSTNANIQIAAFPIIEGTVFMWTETSNHQNYPSWDTVEKITYRNTPRALDGFDDPDDMGFLIVALTSNGFSVIDFFSLYNPLIYYGWSNPTFG
jgi:hypothetical protein